MLYTSFEVWSKIWMLDVRKALIFAETRRTLDRKVLAFDSVFSDYWKVLSWALAFYNEDLLLLVY